jgi:hypothetical protein
VPGIPGAAFLYLSFTDGGIISRLAYFKNMFSGVDNGLHSAHSVAEARINVFPR